MIWLQIISFGGICAVAGSRLIRLQYEPETGIIAAFLFIDLMIAILLAIQLWRAVSEGQT